MNWTGWQTLSHFSGRLSDAFRLWRMISLFTFKYLVYQVQNKTTRDLCFPMAQIHFFGFYTD